jgi:hypothetical protein
MGGSITRHCLAALIVAGVAPGYLIAADAAPDAAPVATANPAPVPPSLSDILAASGITATGYVAASYYVSSGYNTFHEYDTQHNTFQLDQAGLMVAYQPRQGFGALVDLIAGEDARVLNGLQSGSSSDFAVRQAYLQYATGPVTLIGGTFTTLAGEEYSNPSLNTNFSRSLLYFSEPQTHTGVRATWAVTDTLSVIAGVNNGWNTTSTSYGPKTAELGVALTPSRQFSFNLQGYFGKDPGYEAERSLIDFFGTWNVTEALSLVLSYDSGSQQQLNGPTLDWSGAAAYVNYAFNSRWRISVRGEYLDDKDGYNTGTAQTLKEGTVTFGFAAARNFELRLEGRYDKSDQPTFVKTVSTGPVAYDDTQGEFALQGVYKF